MEILPTSHGLFLWQQHYVRELLISTNMQDAKPVSTPFSTSCDLTLTSELSHVIFGSFAVLLVSYNICISLAQMFLSHWINYHNTCKLPLKFSWKLPSVYFAISRGHVTMVFTSLAPQISLSQHFVILIGLEILMIASLLLPILFIWGSMPSLGPLRSNPLLLNL